MTTNLLPDVLPASRQMTCEVQPPGITADTWPCLQLRSVMCCHRTHVKHNTRDYYGTDSQVQLLNALPALYMTPESWVQAVAGSRSAMARESAAAQCDPR